MKNKMNLFKLSATSQIVLKGGGSIPPGCGCKCLYANNDGSSSVDNHDANQSEGKWSKEPTPETKEA